MGDITTIGLDLAKSVFQVHAVDEAGNVVVRKRLRRSQVLGFFAEIPPCLVGLEACATAHHWARELIALGHKARLMPPNYVKAYVKRNKHDVADAEAICEAVRRPSMRFVPIKTAEQQSALMMHRARDLLVRQRTMLVNALRGHLAEFGLIEAQGLHKVAKLIAIVTDENDGRVPDIARQGVAGNGQPHRRYSCTDRWSREAGSRVAQEQPGQPTTGDHSGDRADHRHGHRSNGYRSQHIP
jgi:transposase